MIPETTSSIRYVTDAEGNKTDVLVPVETWKSLLRWVRKMENQDSEQIVEKLLEQRAIDEELERSAAEEKGATENNGDFPVHEQRASMLQEVQAYKAMHPMLVQKHLGEYVAILHGELIDYDKDPVALLLRVREKYPDQVVLQRKVEKQPEPVLHFRSPRFESM